MKILFPELWALVAVIGLMVFVPLMVGFTIHKEIYVYKLRDNPEPEIAGIVPVFLTGFVVTGVVIWALQLVNILDI